MQTRTPITRDVIVAHPNTFIAVARRSVFLLSLSFVWACSATAAQETVRTATATKGAAAATTTAAESSPAAPEACVLVCGGAAALHVEAAVPDYHAADVVNANEVFASMHEDLLACYKARITERPNAHAFLVVDVIVAPDGSVQSVDTTGGALLGDRAMRCITQRIERATFEPVRGGGTLHVQVPLAFTRAPVDDSI